MDRRKVRHTQFSSIKRVHRRNCLMGIHVFRQAWFANFLLMLSSIEYCYRVYAFDALLQCLHHRRAASPSLRCSSLTRAASTLCFSWEAGEGPKPRPVPLPKSLLLPRCSSTNQEAINANHTIQTNQVEPLNPKPINSNQLIQTNEFKPIHSNQ